jgi:phage terminase small subunit
MKRKSKADTVDGAVRAMQNVIAAPLPPPWPLSAAQKPIWDEILMRRARDEWKPIDMRFAWELSDVILRLHEEDGRLRKEGGIIESATGPKVNPRESIVRGLYKRSLALATHLRVHPASEAHESTMVTASRQAEKEARMAMPPPTRADPRREILPVM